MLLKLKIALIISNFQLCKSFEHLINDCIPFKAKHLVRMFVNITKQGIPITNWVVEDTNFKKTRVEINGKVLHWSINNSKTINTHTNGHFARIEDPFPKAILHQNVSTLTT